MVTMVFVLAVIDLIAALFGFLSLWLTRPSVRLDDFILAKCCEGLAWLLFSVCFVWGSQALTLAADLLLLVGTTFEYSQFVVYAQPNRPAHRMVLCSLALLVALSLGALARVSTAAGYYLGLAAYLAMNLYSTAVLFFSKGASRFQRFMAIFYSVVQVAILALFNVLGDEVAKPGRSATWGAAAYYALLITMQLFGSLGYLLLNSERDKTVLRDQATHDALTGSLNRRAFFEIAETMVANASRSRQQVAVIIADLDHFKEVNDTWGHEAGDQLLREFAAAINLAIRHGDISARYGGDEFLLMLPNCDLASAESVAGRILAGLRALRLRVGEAEVGCTASLGISTGFPGSLEDLYRQIAMADEALYAAKRQGRDQAAARPLGEELQRA
jgi:diguanylate cyclase (GGDEF)-like protein